jgi:S-adenosylmethionine:tRNA ribosyltransferase-isomerase
VKTSDFDYDLPESYIAQTPVEPRDSARLMVVDRATGTLSHRIFGQIGDYLRPGDLLVANESRVLPARLFARKVPSGGRVELLLLSRGDDDRTWEALVKGRKTPVGTRLALYRPDRAGFADGDAPAPEGELPLLEGEFPLLEGTITAWTASGGRLIRWDRPIEPLLGELGAVPLPPYIHRPIADPERYQTVYARTEGSVAAPTAGLHFTPELLLALRRQGVQLAFVNLEIGLDTFRPVETEQVEEHRIHTERCSLSAEVARQVNQAKLEGRRVIAVGTTSVRVLETAVRMANGEWRMANGEWRMANGEWRMANGGWRMANGEWRIANGKSQLGTRNSEPGTRNPEPGTRNTHCPWQTVRAFSGSTDLFIYPGFEFRVVDALITNFHLPRSSLLMLVSAFAGRELIMEAYEEAKGEGYRFFSFGDAMLIL